MQKYEKKKAKEVKKCSQAVREVKCTYTKKNDFILEVKTAILEAFWVSELWELNFWGGGGLKNEVKISLSCHFIVNALCDGQVITTN